MIDNKEKKERKEAHHIKAIEAMINLNCGEIRELEKRVIDLEYKLQSLAIETIHNNI